MPVLERDCTYSPMYLPWRSRAKTRSPHNGHTKQLLACPKKDLRAGAPRRPARSSRVSRRTSTHAHTTSHVVAVVAVGSAATSSAACPSPPVASNHRDDVANDREQHDQKNKVQDEAEARRARHKRVGFGRRRAGGRRGRRDRRGSGLMRSAAPRAAERARTGRRSASVRASASSYGSSCSGESSPRRPCW